MKYKLGLFFLLTYAHFVNGQDGVSIGRPAPDPSAILHITAPSNNKGVLFPNSSTLQISNIGNPTDGLFVYDSVFHRYAFRKNTTWMYLNPWDTEQINLGNTTGTNEDIAVISTPYEVRVNNDVSADHFDGFGVVPIGGIIMWSGSETDIPSNYELCDGDSRNGLTTPNLVGRFIRGARSGGSPLNVPSGGVDASSTTSLSFIETPRFRMSGSDCQPFEFIYEVTFDVVCGGSNQTFNLEAAAPSCDIVRNQLIGTIIMNNPTCNLSTITNETCTPSPNPNYYMTNPPCENTDVLEVEAVTDTENRPIYFDVAYIMRVE